MKEYSFINLQVLEIWLTSEDTGAYGKDIDVTIVELLEGIIRVMESHPTTSKDGLLVLAGLVRFMKTLRFSVTILLISLFQIGLDFVIKNWIV
jgi:tRNA A37 methylthiotransferase MiaB